MLPNQAAYFLYSDDCPCAPRQEPPKHSIGDKIVIGFFKWSFAALFLYILATTWR
ncbi:MAG: hypothetical protein LBP75_03780 [Planctomycetota bacterium]|nr:hypothetical protein [Planctomycetota bacterium]